MFQNKSFIFVKNAMVLLVEFINIWILLGIASAIAMTAKDVRNDFKQEKSQWYKDSG